MQTLTGWREKTLSDLCTDVVSGGTPSTSHAEYYDGDIPWLRTQEVNFGYIYDTEIKITKSGLGNSSAKWIPKDTVIIAMYGNSAGRSAYSTIPLTTNQACCNLIIDKQKGDPRFVYFYLLNDYEPLEKLANGGAQQNLNVAIIKGYKIIAPELPEQRAIASMLGSLDDKIELLRKQNETLEQIVRTLFNEQFVKKSANGELPDGWSTGRFGEEFQIVMGQSPKGETFNTSGDGMVFFQGRTDFQGRFPQTRLYTTEPIRVAEPFDLLVSVRAPVGDINVAIEKCCIGRGLAAIRGEARSYTLYKTLSIQDKIRAFDAEGTVFGSVSKTDLSNIEVAIPPKEEVASFEQTVAPIDRKILNNSLHARALAEIRDLLLPKLMRGDIRIRV